MSLYGKVTSKLGRLLTVAGAALIAASGASGATHGQQRDESDDQARPATGRVINPQTTIRQTDQLVAQPPATAAVHANSGPTTHSNVPGHANFVGQDLQRLQNPGASAAAHVNSGPTTHTNVPGHANFSRTLDDSGMRLNRGQVAALQRSLEMPGGNAATHVNSGPTTHSNVPGHADFTMQLQNRQALSFDQVSRMANSFESSGESLAARPSVAPAVRQPAIIQRPGTAASHANSGPTTHSNVPGHANFVGQDLQRLQNPGASAAAHVNSGPTTHTNVPGHANFSRTLDDSGMRLNRSQVAALQRSLEMPGGNAAAHVNSGPTTHSNVPGHADFTMQLQNRQALSFDQVSRMANSFESSGESLAQTRARPQRR